MPSFPQPPAAFSTLRTCDVTSSVFSPPVTPLVVPHQGALGAVVMDFFPTRDLLGPLTPVSLRLTLVLPWIMLQRSQGWIHLHMVSHWLAATARDNTLWAFSSKREETYLNKRSYLLFEKVRSLSWCGSLLIVTAPEPTWADRIPVMEFKKCLENWFGKGHSYIHEISCIQKELFT